jgi:RES domain-containing protein
MTCPVEEVHLDAEVWRLGHVPDAWAWPDWEFVKEADWWGDPEQGGRWDDPDREYHVLYASSSRLAAFLETLAQFEPDATLESDWYAIAGDHDSSGPGELPEEWLEKRLIGRARVVGDFAQAGHSESLAYFNDQLSDFAKSYGVGSIDAAAIRQTAPRHVTQAISRLVYECDDGGAAQFDGIEYGSRHGDDLDNWAIFETADISDATSDPIDVADGDLLKALDRFSVVLVPS